MGVNYSTGQEAIVDNLRPGEKKILRGSKSSSNPPGSTSHRIIGFTAKVNWHSFETNVDIHKYFVCIQEIIQNMCSR